MQWLQTRSLDAFQRLAPRERANAPVTIVEIDEASLEAHGQWPWPRALGAQLLRAIGAHGPAAVGVDVLFTEPDRSSADADAQLAAALRTAPVVLGLAGQTPRDRRFPFPPRVAPVRGATSALAPAFAFEGHLQSRPEIVRGASGQGLLNAEAGEAVIRRVPMVSRVGTALAPSLTADMIRVAAGLGEHELRERGQGLLELVLGELAIPLQRDGTLWLRYGRHDPARFVSAAAVLDGRANPELLRDKLVLVGVTGLGLVDQKLSPFGEQVPGVELHAQVLEQVFDGRYLVRPDWLRPAEALLLALLAGAACWWVPRATPALGAALGAGGALLPLALAGAAFHGGLVMDGATPAAGFLAAFLVVLAATFAERDQQRRVLREAQARVAGELDAARRIQMGLLPDPAVALAGVPALEMRALLEPARSVGGDFYDCVRLDATRVFFVAADVSGKGMPAALFMALSKAILKAHAMRDASELGVAVSRANADLCRENPEALFVTAFAGVLDLRTGMLEYVNAGHEPPLSRRPGGALERFELAGGPPLCVMDDFEYATAYRPLAPGEWLCVVTDGVTEAMDAAGGLYGAERLQALLAALPEGASAHELAARVREDVARFVGGAEPSDDLTLVCLRWSGPSAAGGAAIDDVIDETDEYAPPDEVA